MERYVNAGLEILDGGALSGELDSLRRRWLREEGTRRLWERDSSLWTGGDEGGWLGWLDVEHLGRLAAGLETTLAPVLDLDFRHVVLLGMGGSSLGAEVLGRAGGSKQREAALLVLDTLDPTDQETALEHANAESSIVVVASKSGGTMETSLLADVWSRHVPPGRMVAITDPGSRLEQRAREEGWAAVVHGEPTIGGRYSVLSPFGLAPIRCLGLDLDPFLDSARTMASRCREQDPERNPGVLLGLALGAAYRVGRDKLILAGSSWSGFGLWWEQLIAESTGKQGRGLLPVVDGVEPGPDRVVVSMAGAAVVPGPVLRIEEGSGEGALGGELFRWQIATAVASWALHVHPFDQPDVEAAKIETRAIVNELDGEQALSLPAPHVSTAGLDLEILDLQGAPLRVSELQAGEGERALLDARAALAPLLAGLAPPAYLAVLAYLPTDAETSAFLAQLKRRLQEVLPVAVTLGFGPRYLHSTGQIHKGGDPGGRFLVLSRGPQEAARRSPGVDLEGATSLGTVQLAQAVADAKILAERGRLVRHAFLRGPTLLPGLRQLEVALGF